MQSKKTIAVYPDQDLERRKNLFRSLALVFPVRFVSLSGADPGVVDAVITFDGSLPVNRPTCLFPAPSIGERGETAEVSFASDEALGIPLRGRTISETACPKFSPLTPSALDIVLASIGNDPIWARTPGDHAWQFHSAFAPDELPRQKSLRSLLRDGQFIRHLPLIHFLREVCKDIAFVEPPLRANFTIDDPNIRFQRYGYINYKQLIAEATRHNYSVTFATIPLDLNWMSPGAVRLCKDSNGRLSLVIHGNDHVHHELLRERSNDGDLAVAAQTIRRVERFEKRYGVSVGRVMVPPHSLCSQRMLQALFRLGIQSVCSSRPNCWTPHEKAGDLSAIDDAGPIEWFPADFMEGGMPVIPRKSELFDIVFRAYQHKPLIEYYHHNDFKRGPEVLAETAAAIRSLGDVQWMTLDEISTSNFARKQLGTVLCVRMYSACIELTIPEGVQELHIQLPPVHGEFNIEAAVANGNPLSPSPGEGVSFDPYPCREGETVRVMLRPKNAMRHGDVPGPRPALQPVLRRVIREAQDQLQPFVTRSGR